MLNLLWQFFKTGPDIAQIADSEVVKRKFNSVRWRVFAWRIYNTSATPIKNDT